MWNTVETDFSRRRFSRMVLSKMSERSEISKMSVLRKLLLIFGFPVLAWLWFTAWAMYAVGDEKNE